MDPVEERLAKIERLRGAELVQLWFRLVRSAPPKLSLDLMRLHLANIVQEREEGGLSVRAKRQLGRLQAEVEEAGSRREPGREEFELGTRLIREWRGGIYEVVVTSEGLTFEGKRFGSLTAIARKITGTHWPGPRFFGLRKPGPAKRLRAGSADE